MTTIALQPFSTPFGELVLGAIDNQLCLCHWYGQKNSKQLYRRLTRHLNADMQKMTSPVFTQTVDQLNDYFQQRRTAFNLPLKLVGTDFQQQVWQQLRHVPYGHTISYQQLAEQVDNKAAVRAVANANAANALAIIIPCHRIIGSNGQLTGYAGGLQAKQGLLNLEKPDQNI